MTAADHANLLADLLAGIGVITAVTGNLVALFGANYQLAAVVLTVAVTLLAAAYDRRTGGDRW